MILEVISNELLELFTLIILVLGMIGGIIVGYSNVMSRITKIETQQTSDRELVLLTAKSLKELTEVIDKKNTEDHDKIYKLLESVNNKINLNGNSQDRSYETEHLSHRHEQNI